MIKHAEIQTKSPRKQIVIGLPFVLDRKNT